jgi:hypothetical protein
MDEDIRVVDPWPEVTEINGEPCWTLSQTARLLGNTPGAIRGWVKRGNQLGKLRVTKLARMVFLSVKDLEAFEAVSSGRYGRMRAYRYEFNPETKTVNKVYTLTPVSRNLSEGTNADL